MTLQGIVFLKKRGGRSHEALVGEGEGVYAAVRGICDLDGVGRVIG